MLYCIRLRINWLWKWFAMRTAPTTRRDRFQNTSVPRRVEHNGIPVEQERRISLNRHVIPPLHSITRITVGCTRGVVHTRLRITLKMTIVERSKRIKKDVTFIDCLLYRGRLFCFRLKSNCRFGSNRHFTSRWFNKPNRGWFGFMNIRRGNDKKKNKFERIENKIHEMPIQNNNRYS